MKQTNWLTLLLLSSVTLLNISCKKDKKSGSCTLTEANFAGSYKVQTVKYKASASSPEIDGTSVFFEPCQIDDVTTFNTNHTYTVTDAGTKCDPADDDSGTWSLSGTTITIDSASDEVGNFSCSGFSITESNVLVTGDVGTVTFKKQ